MGEIYGVENTTLIYFFFYFIFSWLFLHLCIWLLHHLHLHLFVGSSTSCCCIICIWLLHHLHLIVASSTSECHMHFISYIIIMIVYMKFIIVLKDLTSSKNIDYFIGLNILRRTRIQMLNILRIYIFSWKVLSNLWYNMCDILVHIASAYICVIFYF